MNKKRTKKKITAKMPIIEVIKRYPSVVPVFLNYGLHCARCPISGPETIEEAVELHQVGLN